MKGKAPYSFLYLVQEGQGVDELGGGRGDDPQPDLGVQGLGHDGVQPLLSQQGQHLMDGLRRERRTGPRGFTSHVVRRLFLVLCVTPTLWRHVPQEVERGWVTGWLLVRSLTS